MGQGPSSESRAPNQLFSVVPNLMLFEVAIKNIFKYLPWRLCHMFQSDLAEIKRNKTGMDRFQDRFKA